MRKKTDQPLHSLTLLAALLVVTGCSEPPLDAKIVCQQLPELCNKLNMEDTHCAETRDNVVMHRYRTIKEPTDIKQFEELLATKKYEKCIELAAQLDVITLKEKKSLRIEALDHAKESILLLEEQLQNADDANILHFLWANSNDTQALNKFLALDEDTLDTPELLLNLANHYAIKDPQKATKLLLKGLSLYKIQESKQEDKAKAATVIEYSAVLREILKTLVTINQQEKFFDLAYLWAQVGLHFQVAIIAQPKLDLMYPMADEKRQQIAAVAQSIIESIENNSFDPALLKKLEKDPDELKQ
ncbi:MAG: DUF2989 domain-containing protein [Vibrionaceae bacterium]